MGRGTLLFLALLVACGKADPIAAPTVPPERIDRLYALRSRMEKVLDQERALYERATREKRTATPARIREWLDLAAARGQEAASLTRALERAHGQLRDGYGWEDPYARNFKRHSAVLFDMTAKALTRFIEAEGPVFDPAGGEQLRSISLAPLAESAADGRLCARKSSLSRRFGRGFARVRVPAGKRRLEYRFKVMRDWTEPGPEAVMRVASYSVDLGRPVAFRDLARALVEFEPALKRPVVICQSIEDRESLVVVIDEESERVQQVARVLAKAEEKRPLPPYGLAYVLELSNATDLEKLEATTEIWSVRKVTAWPRPGHPSWKRLSRARAFPDGLASLFK